jgi:hypothetical protein
MDAAPPPGLRSKIEERGDRLIVRRRPRPPWYGTLFLLVWFTGWTLGGAFAWWQFFHTRNLGTALFFLVWLSIWAVGEVTVAWALFGNEILVVTAESVEVRLELWRFARTKRVELARIERLRVRNIRDEDGDPTKEYRVEFKHGDDALAFGNEMREPEARYVAALVEARIHPPRREDDPWADNAFGWRSESRGDVPAVEREPESDWSWRKVLVPAVVIVAIAWLAVQTLRGPAHREATRTQTRDETKPLDHMPLKEEFESPRDYAAATTLYILHTNGRFVGAPKCDTGATWTSWSCRVRMKPVSPMFAGRTLTYRCRTRREPNPWTGRPTFGILCGPYPPLSLRR